MSSAEVYDSLITELAPLGRAQLLQRLAELHPGFPLDFSDEFLSACETERLRHLVLAATWQCRCRQVATASPVHAAL